MYGVVEIAGHQYKVAPGRLVDVELLKAEVGSFIELDQVLFIGGDTPAVGYPVVNGASVKAKVIEHDRGRKILMMKRKQRVGHKKKGHRQDYTCLLITELKDGRGNSAIIDAESKEAKKYLQ
ncbi:MAG: 50S ribosomal protein L21 [Oligoflexia bacterium]|nr:50S ribosomal protein L21 [Oligoflexia bacterium]MBF0366317.1 50S ribosomal protein L21 [Oligoflexia bacterium]